MRQLSGCAEGDCPKIFDPEDGTDELLVQGLTSAEIVELPAGESAVRIPRAVLEEAARALATAS